VTVPMVELFVDAQNGLQSLLVVRECDGIRLCLLKKNFIL
jgi:hypothetical protein